MLSTDFLFHVGITWSIYYFLATGIQLFLRVRWYIDFSYMWIVLLWSYISVITHIETWLGLFLSFIVGAGIWYIGLLGSSLITSKLSWMYASVWTLSIYVLMFQCVYIFGEITWWAYGLTGITKQIGWWIIVDQLSPFFVYIILCTIFVVYFLTYMKKTYIDIILRLWDTMPWVVASSWVAMQLYMFVLLCIASSIWIRWWTNYAFYYSYIHPDSFRLPMLLLLLVIAFVWYGRSEYIKLSIAMGVMVVYEWLRFLPFIDVVHRWYVREILFSLIIIIISGYVANGVLEHRQNT